MSTERIRTITIAFLTLGLSACDVRSPAHLDSVLADTAALTATTREVFSSLSPSQRAAATFPFNDAERTSWAYVPQRRAGLPLRDMTDAQRAAAFQLVATGLSERGTTLAHGVIELEGTLRELEGWMTRLLLRRNPELYYLSLFVGPNAQPWGWRFEGHHLPVNVTELGAHGKIVAPLFIGANPSRVPSGPRQGQRLLAAEEDLGLELVNMLDTLQRTRAIIAAQPSGDIITGNDPAVQAMKFAGLPASLMTVDQKLQLRRLLELYASRMNDSSATRQLQRIDEVGFDRLHFAWAGATRPGEPHYYRIHGPTVLVEYDNSFGNHIHTVWRDLENDFGGDLLRKHYATHAHRK